MKTLLLLLIVATGIECQCQVINATTDDGRSVILKTSDGRAVILHPDGKWEYRDKENGTEGQKSVAVYKGAPGGGGGGFGLQMTGWRWDEAPKAPKLQESNVRGRIVFEIEVDENGEISSIKTIENQLSASAERLCRQELEKHTLVKSTTGKVPEKTTGRVTFNIDLE